MRFSCEQRPGRVVALLLCCLCLLCLAACTGNNVNTPISTLPTATPGARVAVTLQSLKMLNDKQGWAITHDAHILHTLLGPTVWQDVTPAGDISAADARPTIQSSFFLDENYAWLVTSQNNKLAVWSTSDGGNSWDEAPIGVPAESAISVRFENVWDGWLLLNNGASAANQAVSLLSSTDGGQTWIPLDNADATTGDVSGHVPFTGQKMDLAFSDSSHGWLTGSLGSSNQQTVQIYRSQDGGYSWNAQALTAPENMDTSKGLVTLSPTFFDAQHGILPVRQNSSSGKVAIYATQDGGNTWQASSPSDQISPLFSFVDLQHGWAAGSSAHADTIYSTTDAGKTWQQPGKLPVKITRIDALDFVSVKEGWLLGLNASESDQLFQTTDGGKTWSTPNVQAFE